ncbi:efflux RND transporter periplasmic adaptor subunit [Pedobacter frigidisoli]|uniref:efflux RND transporter periplasmic adaptor subunit n=1 Tax=Pedobacter frigidisoli TaxID=2530455 RepID=UPI00292DDB5D|nr:efflux RND transporter periplasmic adaptor subunit [Pedobacter frigidisoli]
MKLRWMVIPMLVLAFQACKNGNTNNKTNDIVEIPVLKLEAQDTSLTNDYVADIQAVKNVEVRSRMRGFIDRVLVDEGEEVKQGQLLFQLNNREYAIALNKAKANLASALSSASIAGVELERIRTLVDKKVISPSELSLGEAKLSEAESRIKTAKAMIDDANQKLTYARVRAPFSGRIDLLPLKAGSLVEEGALLTTVSDTRQMYAYFDVSENEYLQFVRNGKGRFDHDKETTLILSDGSIYPVKGKIQTHENSFSDHTGSIAFRAMFNNPNHILKHGVSGKIRLNSQLRGSVLVPQKSVFEIQDKSYVFVLDQNNTVKMRSFVPKLSLSGYYVVGSGLKPGEIIVYEGVQELRDGKVIKPVYTSMKKLLASK